MGVHRCDRSLGGLLCRIALTMSFLQGLATLLLLLSLVLLEVSCRPQVQLVSLLPAQPIEPPESWAWGQHPNGLGYKAKNGFRGSVYQEPGCGGLAAVRVGGGGDELDAVRE